MLIDSFGLMIVWGSFSFFHSLRQDANRILETGCAGKSVADKQWVTGIWKMYKKTLLSAFRVCQTKCAEAWNNIVNTWSNYLVITGAGGVECTPFRKKKSSQASMYLCFSPIFSNSSSLSTQEWSFFYPPLVCCCSTYIHAHTEIPHMYNLCRVFTL